MTEAIRRKTVGGLPQKSKPKIAVHKKAKPKLLNADAGELTVRTPKDDELQFLTELGIVAPAEIPSDEPDKIPLDFTGLSSRTIGAIHSRYAVRHSHALYHLALRAARLASLRRNARISEAKFRVVRAGEKKTDVDALMEDDRHIAKVRNDIVDVEIEMKILEAVVGGYELIRNAASREISRRTSERAQTD